MNLFLDTNIWVSFLAREESNRALALRFFSRAKEGGCTLYASPQILCEIWAVMTRPASANGYGQSPDFVDKAITLLRRDVVLLPFTDDVSLFWQKSVYEKKILGRRTYDAAIAAVMGFHGLSHLITYNIKDFGGFSGIHAQTPEQFMEAA